MIINWLKRYGLMIIFTALFFFYLYDLYDLNVIRHPKGYQLEREMIFDLTRQGIYRPGDYFKNADTVCFLPFYGEVSGIDVPMAKNAYDELIIKIDHNGRSDGYWWIVGLKGGEIEFLYKISRKVHKYNKYPDNNTAICIGTKGFFLKSLPSEEGYRSLIFEVIHEGGTQAPPGTEKV